MLKKRLGMHFQIIKTTCRQDKIRVNITKSIVSKLKHVMSTSSFLISY